MYFNVLVTCMDGDGGYLRATYSISALLPQPLVDVTLVGDGVIPLDAAVDNNHFGWPDYEVRIVPRFPDSGSQLCGVRVLVGRVVSVPS